jgi:hypothetical protein
MGMESEQIWFNAVESGMERYRDAEKLRIQSQIEMKEGFQNQDCSCWRLQNSGIKDLHSAATCVESARYLGYKIALSVWLGSLPIIFLIAFING